MENTEEKNDVFVRLKTKKASLYKAGPELTDKVTMVEVEISEEQTETTAILDLNVHIQTQRKLKVTDAVIK